MLCFNQLKWQLFVQKWMNGVVLKQLGLMSGVALMSSEWMDGVVLKVLENQHLVS